MQFFLAVLLFVFILGSEFESETLQGMVFFCVVVGMFLIAIVKVG